MLQVRAPLKVPRRLHATAAVGGRVYVFGGVVKEASIKVPF
jgi:hypothetical protein